MRIIYNQIDFGDWNNTMCSGILRPFLRYFHWTYITLPIIAFSTLFLSSLVYYTDRKFLLIMISPLGSKNHWPTTTAYSQYNKFCSNTQASSWTRNSKNLADIFVIIRLRIAVIDRIYHFYKLFVTVFIYKLNNKPFNLQQAFLHFCFRWEISQLKNWRSTKKSDLLFRVFYPYMY